MKKTLITRKELLQRYPDLTYDILQENEEELGLADCRVKISKRSVFYDEKKAEAALSKLGL